MSIMSRLVSKKELSEILGFSVGKIEKMMKNGSLKYYKIDRNVRFDLDSIKDDLKVFEKC